MSRSKYLFVSYWPLYGTQSDRQTAPSDPQELIEHLKADFPDGKVEGCTWMFWPPGQQGVLTPVFIVPDAHRIADHLVAWSENDPSQWFELNVVNHQGGYAVLLMPEVEKSVKRWKARQHADDDEDIAEATFYAVFRPLRFFNTAPSHLWPDIYASLPRSMMLGFLDAKDACWDDPRSTDCERIRFVGPFRRGDNSKLGAYADEVFNGLGPPDFKGWTNPTLSPEQAEIVGPNN